MIWSVHNDLTEGKLATHDAVSSKLPPRKILSQTEEAAQAEDEEEHCLVVAFGGLEKDACA